MPEELHHQYQRLKSLANRNLLDDRVTGVISEMALHARKMLRALERVQLVSRVPNKRYFGFRGIEESRPINENLYVGGELEFERLLEAFHNGFHNSEDEEVIQAAYTIGYSVFAANDVYEVGRKASATFFEVLVGHIISRALRISPRLKVQIPESGADLPTDYVFDPGTRSRKVHVPIKTSTRERGVQAWVHQLVLDRIFGTGVYRGVFVVAAETKRNAKTRVVTEICVPQQLQMFQARVAEISRVYYLDPPQAYLALSTQSIDPSP